MNDATQRRRLRRACADLQLAFGYRWYSVRRGGATHWYQQAQDLNALLVKGRWGALKTAKVYIQDAQAQLSELQVPPRHAAWLRSLALALCPSLEG